MTLPTFELHPGKAPLLVSFPHSGERLPEEIARRMTPSARVLADTDWHLPLLYAFVRELGASTLVATHSRYVIDLNRPPDDENLYPGQDTTSLVPIDSFAGEPLYMAGEAPDAAELDARRERYWQPYHAALQSELARLRREHRRVVLWDAHSIASRVPRFFEGLLPALNLGTVDGLSCAPALEAAVTDVLAAQSSIDWVCNGRFKGGFITRRYGSPDAGIHAIQLEMSQRCYMDEEPPFAYRPVLAQRIAPLVAAMLGVALNWAAPR